MMFTGIMGLGLVVFGALLLAGMLIPIIIEDPEPVDLFTTSSTVSYTTSLSLQEALEFYKQEMIAHGWTYISNGSLETANLAVLWYETSDQDASVTLNASSPGGETLVLISVVPK